MITISVLLAFYETVKKAISYTENCVFEIAEYSVYLKIR